MTLIDEPVWRGTIYSGGRAGGTGGDAPVMVTSRPIPSRQISLAS